MRFCTLILLVAMSLHGAAQTNEPVTRKLSLLDCIQLALAHNLQVQINRLDPDIARYALAATYGDYDPNLSFSGEHTYRLSPAQYDGVDPQGRNYAGTETEADVLRGGLTGLMPWGLNYSLGVSASDTYGTRSSTVLDRSQPTLVTNSFLDINSGNTISRVITNYPEVSSRAPFENADANVGFLSLRQPLLRNFWVDSTRLQIQLNRSDLKISDLALRQQIMTTITQVEEAYYNLFFAQENIKVQEAALGLAERLLAENRKRVEVGALAPLDEKQAEAQAAGNRAELIAARGNEDTQQRVLKLLLSDDYSKWTNVRIVPAEPAVALPMRFDLQGSWRNGLSRRPDLEQQRIALEKQGHIVRFQKNQALPSVDLVGSYGYRGTGDEFAGAFDQVGRTDYPYWSYGAELSMPLSRTASRNNLRSAKATRDQIILQVRQLEQRVLVEIENALANASTAFQRATATREARTYAQAALDAEQKKLENGKSTNFEVLRLQRDLTTARSEEIRAVADYNIALARVAFSEGTTLERRNVTMEVVKGAGSYSDGGSGEFSPLPSK